MLTVSTRLLPLMLALTALLWLSPAGAQEAALQTPDCDVEPRTETEMQALSERAATPQRPASSTAPAELPAGEPVDDALQTELLAVLNEARACTEAGDLARLLALFTDRYAIEALAPEPVGIVAAEGTPAAAPLTPEPADRRPVIEDAVRLEDGRVAARVTTAEPGGPVEIVWFSEVDGQWRIDEIQVATTVLATPDAAKEGLNLAVNAAIANARAEFGGDPYAFSVITVEQVEWPDSALGCPQPDQVYQPVVTPGYRIVIATSEQTLEYHADQQGNVVRCETEA